MNAATEPRTFAGPDRWANHATLGERQATGIDGLSATPEGEAGTRQEGTSFGALGRNRTTQWQVESR